KCLSSSDDATKAKMTGRRVNWLGHPRCRTISLAIVRCAEKRSALHHFARDQYLRLAWIKTLFAFAAAWIKAATACLLDLVVLLVPVGGPFPNISRHVVKTVTVRRI